MRRRIPLNLFAMPFGLAGLAGCWLTAAGYGLVPAAVGYALVALAAAVWLVLVALYLGRPDVAGDLGDRIAGPFASLVLLTPMLVAAEGVYPLAPAAGRVLVDLLVALTVLLGAWLTGDWILRPVERDTIHPGWFLPTVAGGFVAAIAAATVGQDGLALVVFGLGAVCWLVLGSVVLVRLVTGPALPTPLVPTLAIEVAPAAVATLAWFAMRGDQVDAVVSVLGGYGLLMVLAQVRLLPAFLALRFGPGMWGFTFSWAAVASAAMHWLHAGGVSVVCEYLLLVAVTLLVGGIAARTLVAVLQGRLLPAPVQAVRKEHAHV
jgi:tellurite resistance protein